jgi:SHS2 domain-containing protein
MYRWVDHTAELELHVEAPTREGVFREALVALGELLGERTNDGNGDPVSHEVVASAPDLPALLAEWLSELAFLAEAEGFIPETVATLKLADDELEATVGGRRGSPPPLIKAVTYHRLAMAERGGAWHATVVLDV